MTPPTLLSEVQTVRRPVAWWGVWVAVAVGLNAAGVLVAFHDYVPPPEVLHLQAGADRVVVPAGDLVLADGQPVARFPLEATAGEPAGPVAVEYTTEYAGADPVPLTATFDRRPDGGYALPVPPPPGSPSPDEPTECRVRLRSVTGAVLGPGPRPRREGVLVLPPIPSVQFTQPTAVVPSAEAFAGADLYVRGTLRDAPGFAVVLPPAADPVRTGQAVAAGDGWRVPADVLKELSLSDSTPCKIRLAPPRGAILGLYRELDVRVKSAADGKKPEPKPEPKPVRIVAWAADPPSVPATTREAVFRLTLDGPVTAAIDLPLTFGGTGAGRLKDRPEKMTLGAGEKTKALAVPLAPPEPGEESARTITAVLTVPDALGGPGTRNADLTLIPSPPPPAVRLAVQVRGAAAVNPAAPDVPAEFVLSLDRPAPDDVKVTVQFDPDMKDTAEFGKHVTGPQEVTIKKQQKEAVVAVRAVAPVGGRIQPNRQATVRFGPPAGVTPVSPAALTQAVRVTERLEDRPFLVLVVPPADDKAGGDGLARVLADWAVQKDAGRAKWVRAAAVVRKDDKPLAVAVVDPAALAAVPKGVGVGPLAAPGRGRAVQVVNDVMDARRDLIQDLGKEDRDRIVTVVLWPSLSTPAELDGAEAPVPLAPAAEAGLKELPQAGPGGRPRLAFIWYSPLGDTEDVVAQTRPLEPIWPYLPNRRVRVHRPDMTGAELNRYLLGTLPRP